MKCTLCGKEFNGTGEVCSQCQKDYNIPKRLSEDNESGNKGTLLEIKNALTSILTLLRVVVAFMVVGIVSTIIYALIVVYNS